MTKDGIEEWVGAALEKLQLMMGPAEGLALLAQQAVMREYPNAEKAKALANQLPAQIRALGKLTEEIRQLGAKGDGS